VNPSRLLYARAVLAYGSLQRGPEYEQCLVAIFTAEDSRAEWNPGDTTLFYPDATPYNDFGPGGQFHVWNYPTGLIGVHSTVATLVQPNMSAWYKAMRTPGLTALQLARAFSQTPWGGLGDVLPLEVVQDWNADKRPYGDDRAVLVAGSGTWPFNDAGDQMREE